MTGCLTSGHGDCCDGRGGCGVTHGFHVGGRVHESVKTGAWSLDTAACQGPAGLVWYRSSLASSWGLQSAAEGWRIPAKDESSHKHGGKVYSGLYGRQGPNFHFDHRKINILYNKHLDFNLQGSTHMIRRRASSSTTCAASITVLAGAPLSRGGVGILALACDCSNGIEHLRGHVAGESVDGSR